MQKQDSLSPQATSPPFMAQPQHKQAQSPQLLNSPKKSQINSFQISKLPQSTTPTYKNTFQLTIVVTLISLSSFYFGFSLTYLQTIPQLTLVQYYGTIIQHDATLPILIGAMPVGAIFGSLLAQFVMKYFTRKKFLIFVNILAFITNLLIQITNVWILLTCRIFTGIFVGLYMGIVPIYIKQICPKQVSGFYGAFTQMQHLLGNCISYLFGMIFYLADFQGQFMMRFQFLFTSFLITLQMIFIFIGYIPESPNSLLRYGKIQQAKDVLRLFNDQSMIQQLIHQKIIQNKSSHIKLSQIQQNDTFQQKQSNRQVIALQTQQKQVKNQQKIKMTYKTYILGFQLPFTQQLTGVNFLVTQLTAITSLYNASLSHYTALIANVIQFIATSLSTQLLDRLGRRPLILAGNFSIAVLNIIIGLLFMALHYWNWQPGFPIAMVFIMIFNVVFGLTLGPVVWLYIPQIVTQRIVPLATATYWCGCSICVIFAPIVTNSMGTPFAVFLFFGVYLFAVFLPNHILVVQTKGLTAEEISQKFKTK